MFGKKKAKSKEEHSSHYSLRLERRKKTSTQANNYSAEYLCKNSSSSESLDNLISYKLKGRKGFSLDRNIQSFDVEQKPQVKPKRSSWFLRDKSREKKEKFLKRSSLDFTVTYDTKQEKPRAKNKTIQRQNAADFTGDSSTTPQEEVVESKKGGLKRFLKGEIGIRSFNYYLLKEGLKKNQVPKQESIAAKPSYKSKSEENIYEEIYFRSDLPIPKPRTPPALPPFNKQPSLPLKQKKPLSDDGSCMNCEICLQEAQKKSNSMCTLRNCDKCVVSHHHPRTMTNSLSGSEGYAQVVRKHDGNTIYDFFQKQNEGQTVLQFQSYNPNNPSVYKIETTPVAFDYKSIEEQIYQMELNQQYARAVEQQQQHFSADGKIVSKTSSSSDSIKGHNQRRRQQQMPQQSNEFYTRPTFSHGPSEKQVKRDKNQSMYKTDSSNSIRSENSLNKIYNSKNSSQKSNQSTKSVTSNHNRDDAQIRQDMSDSSLGDSLFSSDANKRYFGSSESCRFNYECRRRCSLENEKCSFSDTCRYECNLRNCDCSSSYFSSDFDDTNIYNSASHNNRMMKSHHDHPQIEKKAVNCYAEDFIKHVSNVKRRSQNIPFDGNTLPINTQQMMTASIYEVPKKNPKRLEMAELLCVEGGNDTRKMVAEDLGIKDSDRMLTQTEGDKTETAKSRDNGQGKATGTVPKMSSSISSNDSKKRKSGQKLDKENQQKELNRNQADESEAVPKEKRYDDKSPANEKILSDEIPSVTVETAEKLPSDKTKSLERDARSEHQKNIDADNDDNDDVFLDNKKEPGELEENVSRRFSGLRQKLSRQFPCNMLKEILSC